MEYHQKLKDYIVENGIDAEQLLFKHSTHSVAEAAEAAQATAEDFVKNICLVDSERRLIVAIVKGEDRVSTKRVARILEIERPRQATVEEIQELTGYPIGGVPSFSYEAIFLIDERVMEKDMIYTGGGNDHSLVKISPGDLIKSNNGLISKIRK